MEGGSGGANNVLGWPSYKIFSWTCCYAIHPSLALYLATRYQFLFLTCKTLLIVALLFLVFFLGGFWGGANNVLGWPSYKIFSWTCCYAIHSSLALHLKNCRHTKRKDGHHKMSQGVQSMIQQWMWRQTILPCSPKN